MKIDRFLKKEYLDIRSNYDSTTKQSKFIFASYYWNANIVNFNSKGTQANNEDCEEIFNVNLDGLKVSIYNSISLISEIISTAEYDNYDLSDTDSLSYFKDYLFNKRYDDLAFSLYKFRNNDIDTVITNIHSQIKNYLEKDLPLLFLSGTEIIIERQNGPWVDRYIIYFKKNGVKCRFSLDIYLLKNRVDGCCKIDLVFLYKRRKTYKELTERLLRQCESLEPKVRYIVREYRIPDGSYQDLINYKPKFLREIMDEIRADGDNESPIVYMDTDMYFEKFPHLFNETHFDYMGYNWNGGLITSGEYNPITTHVSGGIMYFGNNALGYNLLSKWCIVTDNNPGKAEDRIISIIINNDPILISYRIMWLPGYYLWLEDKWESYGTRFSKGIRTEDIVISHPENLTSEEMATNNSGTNRSPIIGLREYIDVFSYGQTLTLSKEIQLKDESISRKELYTDDENLYLTTKESSSDNNLKLKTLSEANLLQYKPYNEGDPTAKLSEFSDKEISFYNRHKLQLLPEYKLESNIKGIIVTCVKESNLKDLKDHINTIKKKLLKYGIVLLIYSLEDDLTPNEVEKHKILAILCTLLESYLHKDFLNEKSLVYIDNIGNLNLDIYQSKQALYSLLVNVTSDIACQNFNTRYFYLDNDPENYYCDIKSSLSLQSLRMSNILFRMNKMVLQFVVRWYHEFNYEKWDNIYNCLDVTFAKYNISQYFRCLWLPLTTDYNTANSFSVQCKLINSQYEDLYTEYQNQGAFLKTPFNLMNEYIQFDQLVPIDLSIYNDDENTSSGSVPSGSSISSGLVPSGSSISSGSVPREQKGNGNNLIYPVNYNN